VGEQQPHGLKTRHGSEDLLEVHPLLLDVAFGDKTGFVLGDDPRLIPLGLEDPFESDRLRVRRGVDEYALDAVSYPTKIIFRLRSSSFLRLGAVTLTWATLPNVRR
jgi:hypothetical protein